MKIKTLIFAAIACMALVCTGCSKGDKGETKLSYVVEFSEFDPTNEEMNNLISECQDALDLITDIDDTKAINAVAPIMSKYQYRGNLKGTATLYKSVGGGARTVVQTWGFDIW